MSIAVGTLGWARARNGQLTRRERLRGIANGIVVLVRTAPAQVRQRLGLPNPRAFEYDLDRLVIPDSEIARDAEDLCREASSDGLVNHCLRTYAWGAILGARDGLEPDPELLYVGSLLHDLALTDRFRDHSPMACFAARGAIAATEWAAERGWPEHRCATLGDAISLHLNIRVPEELGPEARLLQAGAALDAAGMRYWDLDRKTASAVVDRYPRHRMKEELYPLFIAEAKPRTRAQLLQRWLRFGTLVRRSQFAE
jgi:hypothetical protein